MAPVTPETSPITLGPLGPGVRARRCETTIGRRPALLGVRRPRRRLDPGRRQGCRGVAHRGVPPFRQPGRSGRGGLRPLLRHLHRSCCGGHRRGRTIPSPASVWPARPTSDSPAEDHGLSGRCSPTPWSSRTTSPMSLGRADFVRRAGRAGPGMPRAPARRGRTRRESGSRCDLSGVPGVGPGMHGIVDLRITHPHLPWPDPLVMLTDLQRTLGLQPSA